MFSNVNPEDEVQLASPKTQTNESVSPLAHIHLEHLDEVTANIIMEKLSVKSSPLSHIVLQELDKITAHAVKVSVQKAEADAIKQNEQTHSSLLFWLVKLFSGSLTVCFIIATVAIVNPKVDKNFVKEVLPILIAPQVTLLCSFYGAYCLRSRSRKNKG